jgi:hypothetical protein
LALAESGSRVVAALAGLMLAVDLAACSSGSAASNKAGTDQPKITGSTGGGNTGSTGLLARTYRINSAQTPVMIITEWFLKTLIPFLSLA